MRWIIFLISILLLNTVSAITTNLAESYQPGETIIIKIEGNILEPIYPSDVVFKRNHVAVAVNYDLKKIDGIYYLYAQTPINPNNYTLYINDISTTVNGVSSSVDFNQSFKVEGNLTDYSISPGFIISNSQSIDLTINSNLDQQSTISSNFPDEHSIILNPGSNIVSLSTSGKSPGVYSEHPIFRTCNFHLMKISSKYLLKLYPL